MEEEEFLEEEGIDKDNLDTAIIAAKLICERLQCDPDNRGRVIARIYKRLQELSGKEE